MNGFRHPGASRIRAAAAALGVKQREVAAQLNVTPTSVGRWFRGEDLPSRDRLIELEVVLELPRGELCVLFGYLPEGEVEIVERTDSGGLMVRVSGSSIPGYLNLEMERLFDLDPDPVLVAA